MKKRIGLIFIVLLVALLAAALVACDPDPSNPLSPENPSQSTYTVTFDLNGALWDEEALAPITGVKYGDTIPEPLKKNGDPIVPTKRGYDFKGWIANNETFIFGEGGTKIVSNTTIRANFEAKKYYHIPDIYTTISYENGKYVLDPNGHATEGVDSTDVLKNSLGEPVKDGDNTIPVPATDITFAEGAIGENTTIYSTYNTTTPSRIAVPSRPAAEGTTKDNFCFWYYMADTLGEDGTPLKDSSGATVQHPVQFTEWASKNATDVAVRKIAYSYDKPLTLYAMFESDLPLVTVEYYESETSETALNKDAITYRLGDKIPEADKFVPTLSETTDHAMGYDFDHWYFVYTTESEKEGEDPVRNVQKFVFETFDENGNSLNKDSATSPMDAAHDDEIPEGEQNFRPVTLKLYANWVKRIEIGSADDYNTKLAEPIGKLLSEINAIKEGEPVPEDKQKALDEYLTATIKFTADINFKGAQLSPLFDAAHPFAGIIDGGNYTEGSERELALSGSYKLSNATVEGANFASLFGYVNGAVKNLTVENIALSATSANAELCLGALASVSGGLFTNCVVTNITFTLPENAGLTYIGGLTGKLSGTSNDEEKGTISECKVTLTLLSGLTASGLHIGALVGESGSSTTISNCTATLTVSEVKTTAEFSGLMIGAVAGNSVANVSACEATLTVNEGVLAGGTAYIGGLIGHNEGSISKSHATFNTSALSLGSTASLQLLAVGGFVGRNEGDIINSYSTAHITFTLIANQDAHIGGFVGLNSTSRTDNQSDKEKGLGAINRCYSEGSVSASADAAVKSADLYVGGMIGLSKHSKFANNFTLVTVTVSYNTDKTDLIHAGFLFGALDKDASITSGYYAKNGKVTVNGTTYNGSEFAPKEEGDSADEQTTENAICSLGTPRDKADFADKKIVFGTNTDDIKDNLGWAGGNEDASKNIWELKDGAAAPTLIGIGFPQESQEG